MFDLGESAFIIGLMLVCLAVGFLFGHGLPSRCPERHSGVAPTIAYYHAEN